MALPVFIDTCALARFASNAVIAIHVWLGFFACVIPIRAFVFAGFPTTNTFASDFAFSPIAFP